MRSRFLVHVGPHKTGTTYLQDCLTALREVLATHGICYPTQWQLNERGGHFFLPERIRQGNPDLVQEFAQLRDSRYEVILISAEGLSSLNRAQIGQLKELIGDADADIVFYVRRFSELLPSSWQEDVKQGSRTTLPVYLYNQISYPGISLILNIEYRISHFVSVFGADHVKLVSYNNILDESGDIFRHFTGEFLGHELEPVDMQSRPNTSLGPVDTEMIRALNGVHHRQAGEPGPLLRLGYFQSVVRQQPEHLGLLRSAMEKDLATLRLGDDIAALHGSHMKALRRFGAQIVNPRPDGSFFAPRATQPSYVDGNYMVVPGCFDVLWQLYRSALAHGRARAAA